MSYDKSLRHMNHTTTFMYALCTLSAALFATAVATWNIIPFYAALVSCGACISSFFIHAMAIEQYEAEYLNRYVFHTDDPLKIKVYVGEPQDDP